MSVDKCKSCGSTNVYRSYTKVGFFVSYYTLICRDCSYEEECRENG